MSSVLVLGLGNTMRGDDGIGVHVAELLRQTPLPPGVEVRTGGIADLDVLEAIAGRAKVIALDAVQGGGPPGEIYRFDVGHGEMSYRPVTSIHELGLIEAVALAHQLGMAPDELVVIGVEPRSLDLGTGLSAEVARAATQMVDLVIEEIRPQAH